MDRELVTSPQSETTGGESIKRSAPCFCYKDLFAEVLPYYLSIGMTYEQFYEDHPDLVLVYRKADELRRKQRNQELWLQGMYIYDALCDASPLFHSFAKAGTKAHPYPDEPYPITHKDVEARKDRKARQAMEKGKDMMKAFAAQFNERFKKNREE